MSVFHVLLFVLFWFSGNQVEQITAIHVESLEYPVVARGAQIQGKVELDVIISAQGSVISASCVSGPSSLRTAAEENARKWKFSPSSEKERHIGIEYEFVLEEPKTDYKPETKTSYDLPTRVRVTSSLPSPQP